MTIFNTAEVFDMLFHHTAEVFGYIPFHHAFELVIRHVVNAFASGRQSLLRMPTATFVIPAARPPRVTRVWFPVRPVKSGHIVCVRTPDPDTCEVAMVFNFLCLLSAFGRAEDLYSRPDGTLFNPCLAAEAPRGGFGEAL